MTDEAGLLNSLLFLPLSIYYALPALISPETYFVTGLGVGPRGFGGILISIVLYSAIAYLISIISEKNSSKRKEK